MTSCLGSSGVLQTLAAVVGAEFFGAQSLGTLIVEIQADVRLQGFQFRTNDVRGHATDRHRRQGNV